MCCWGADRWAPRGDSPPGEEEEEEEEERDGRGVSLTRLHMSSPSVALYLLMLVERQRKWPIMEQCHVWLSHLVSRVRFITETPHCEKRKISTATSEEIVDKKGKVSLPVW